MDTQHENTQTAITVTEKNLPLHCPMPDMLQWNAHPRVYLPIEQTGTARCPYCSTQYTLKKTEIQTEPKPVRL